MWGRAGALLGGAKASKLPKPVRINRPEPVRPKRKVETDQRVIAAFFKTHITGGR